MSMYDGLDLSRFRHVASDNKTTTLRHSKGHEIKIANSALTPKMREKIATLQAEPEPVKLYAGGSQNGPVAKDDGAPELVAPAPEQAQGIAPGQQAGIAPPPPMQAQEPQQVPQAQPSGGVPPKPAVMPEAGQVNITGERPKPPPPTPQQVAAQMTNEDLNFQKDLAMGHVKPETYQSLYAKKDTLGKIGTLFGLLVSGAGAGLTKQPNAVMEMMNKEIERDYDAQKTTQGNAQNWRTLAQKQEFQKAQMEQMGYQNLLTLGQAQAIPSQIEASKAQTQQAYANAGLATQQSGLIKAKLGALQYLQDQANRMPPGPLKDAAQSAFDNLSSNMKTNIEQTNLKTAEEMAAQDKMIAQEDEHDSGVDLEKLTLLKNVAASSSMLDGIPNKQGVDADAIRQAEEEAKMVAANRAAYSLYRDAFKDLDKKFAASALNPEEYNAQVELAATEIAKATGNASSESIAKFKSALFPAWKDYGGSRETKMQKANAFFASQEKKAATLDRLGLIKPFPKEGQKRFKEGDRKAGHIVKGGKWVKEAPTKQAAK